MNDSSFAIITIDFRVCSNPTKRERKITSIILKLYGRAVRFHPLETGCEPVFRLEGLQTIRPHRHRTWRVHDATGTKLFHWRKSKLFTFSAVFLFSAFPWGRNSGHQYIINCTYVSLFDFNIFRTTNPIFCWSRQLSFRHFYVSRLLDGRRCDLASAWYGR